MLSSDRPFLFRKLLGDFANLIYSENELLAAFVTLSETQQNRNLLSLVHSIKVVGFSPLNSQLSSSTFPALACGSSLKFQIVTRLVKNGVYREDGKQNSYDLGCMVLFMDFVIFYGCKR